MNYQLFFLQLEMLSNFISMIRQSWISILNSKQLLKRMIMVQKFLNINVMNGKNAPMNS